MYQQHGGTVLNVGNIEITGCHGTVLHWKGPPMS